VLDPDQPALWDGGIPHVRRDLKTAEGAARRVFSLPCFPELTDTEVEHVCARLARL
jgi:dTDP-4-amino-4,6-dideoxygalactose transaminase